MYLQYACNAKANWADLLTVKIHHSAEKRGKDNFVPDVFAVC